MPAPSTLDEASIDRLAHLLDTRAVPFGGLNLEALDGLFSALIVGPALVPPSEWMDEVWGGKSPNWESLDEAQDVMNLLMGHWNTVATRVRYAGDQMREDLLPYVWLPEDETDSEAHLTGHDWAVGFLRGIELRKPAWEHWFDQAEWITEAYLDLVALVLGRHPAAQYARLVDAGVAAADVDASEVDASKLEASELEGSAEVDEDAPLPGERIEAPPLRYEERLETVLDLPWLLYDLNVYRIETMTSRVPLRAAVVPGRNDPCSCGSGKKYKKCCGAG